MAYKRGKSKRNAKEKAFRITKSEIKTLRAYNIKESLRKFWECKNREEAEQYLKKWYFGATHSRLLNRKERLLFPSLPGTNRATFTAVRSRISQPFWGRHATKMYPIFIMLPLRSGSVAS